MPFLPVRVCRRCRSAVATPGGPRSRPPRRSALSPSPVIVRRSNLSHDHLFSPRSPTPRRANMNGIDPQTRHRQLTRGVDACRLWPPHPCTPTGRRAQELVRSVSILCRIVLRRHHETVALARPPAVFTADRMRVSVCGRVDSAVRRSLCHETATQWTGSGAPVDGLDDVDELLLLLKRPVDLVIVTSPQIDHDVLHRGDKWLGRDNQPAASRQPRKLSRPRSSAAGSWSRL